MTDPWLLLYWESRWRQNFKIGKKYFPFQMSAKDFLSRAIIYRGCQAPEHTSIWEEFPTWFMLEAEPEKARCVGMHLLSRELVFRTKAARGVSGMNWASAWSHGEIVSKNYIPRKGKSGNLLSSVSVLGWWLPWRWGRWWVVGAKSK